MESPALSIAVVLDPLLSADGPIAIRDGLNVVYGLNGAGKTRLVEGLQGALRGVHTGTGVALLLSAGKPDHAFDRGGYHRSESFTMALAKSLAASDGHAKRPRALEGFGAGHDLPQASAIVDDYLEKLLPPSGASRDWVLGNRLFLLVPTGTPSAPVWEAWAVADPRLEWVRNEEASLTTAFKEYDAGFESEFDEEYDESEQDQLRSRYRAIVADSLLFPPDDRELHPTTKPGHIWDLGPYSAIGFGIGFADEIPSVVIADFVDFGVDLIDYAVSVESVTSDHLHRSLDQYFDWNSEPNASGEVIELAANAVADALSTAVTERIRSVLIDGPSARLVLTHSTRRLFSPAFEWRFAREGYRWREMAIDGLSHAERVWAERSIIESAYASFETNGGRGLRVYDEPETGLHRSAESQMARSLLAQLHGEQRIIVAATHSPELLDAPGANLIEVHRGPNRSVVRDLDISSKVALTELGLNPSDLLRLTRVFLLVEGLHDQVLLEYFLGDRLRRARVDVIPIRGGKRLASTVDSRVLFDYTEAHIVALLDNTDASRVSTVWQQAVEVAAAGGTPDAKQLVVQGIGYDDGESQYLTTWLTRALDFGVAGRMTPIGLSAADIIEYLPVDRIVEGARSWGDLRRQHQLERESALRTPKDFKVWLANRFGAKFDESDLEGYAAGMGVPKEFERLMKALEAITAERS